MKTSIIVAISFLFISFLLLKRTLRAPS
jgi:hypothetical protein